MSTSRWHLNPLEVAAVLAYVALFVGTLVVFHYLFGKDPEKALREQQVAILSSLAETPPASLQFFPGRTPVRIENPAEIKEFLHCLVESEAVPRHHSHPADELRFRLIGSGTTYRIGRDSQARHEYWLQLNEGTSQTRTIKLLRSEELSAWLLRKGLLKQ